jgi:hypothetical protein
VTLTPAPSTEIVSQEPAAEERIIEEVLEHPIDPISEDIRLQIALFEQVTESLRAQLERMKARETEANVRKETKRREKLLSPDKSVNDSVLFKLHESARVNEDQIGELLRLVRLLEENGAQERAMREEIERELATAKQEKEALLEQAVAITLEKEQLLQEKIPKEEQNENEYEKIDFEAKLAEERSQAAKQLELIAREWQEKLESTNLQRENEKQELATQFEAEKSARARQFEEEKQEFGRTEVAKAFLCFEGKQRQFDSRVSEMEKEIEIRKVMNLSHLQEIQELKVLTVHLEMEQEKADANKIETEKRCSELEQANESLRVAIAHKEAELESSAQHWKREIEQMVANRSEMEAREQVRANELKCEMEKLQAMRGEMEQRTLQTEEIKAQLEGMRSEMERRQDQLAHLKAQLGEKNNHAEELTRQLQGQQAALQAREESIELQRQELENRQSLVLGELQSEIEALKSQLDRQSQQYAEETSRKQEPIEAMPSQANLESAMSELKRELECAQNELEKKSIACRHLEKELALSHHHVNIGMLPSIPILSILVSFHTCCFIFSLSFFPSFFLSPCLFCFSIFLFFFISFFFSTILIL